MQTYHFNTSFFVLFYHKVHTLCEILHLHASQCSNLSFAAGKTATTCTPLSLPRMAWDRNTGRRKGDDWHYCGRAEAAAAVWKPTHNCTLQVRPFVLTIRQHNKTVSITKRRLDKFFCSFFWWNHLHFNWGNLEGLSILAVIFLCLSKCLAIYIVHFPSVEPVFYT